MSIIRGSEIKRGNSSIITPAIEISDEKVPICAIKFLEASAEIICCGTVAGGGIFCMSREEYCTTTSHT